MAGAELPKWSLRLERAESSRLVRAVVISLALHLLIGGGYYTEKKTAWLAKIQWPAWLKPAQKLAEMLVKKPPPPAVPREVPLMFVDVTPAQATAEPPKDAKHYSSLNSQAANPKANLDSDTPKISGTQNQMVKTEDVPREKFTPLQPAPPSPPSPPTEQPQEEQKAKPAQTPGDLALAKPEPTPRKDEGEAPRPRPRTLREARARLAPSQLPGQRMSQEGGVRRHLEFASLDARATPFGAYDRELVDAIAQCWYGLLDQQGYASDYRGKVVLQFQLHYDGQITDLTIAENTAGNMPGRICQTAVDKPKPYPVFPSDMRRIVGDSRSIQFTFYYN